MVIQPFDETAISPLIAALPKADLHLHQEAPPRLQRIAARRQSELPYDWLSWAQQVFVELPPGMARLVGIYQPDASMAADWWPHADPELFIERIVDVLEGAASDGAVLAEVRFGADRNFMSLFREANGECENDILDSTRRRSAYSI